MPTGLLGVILFFLGGGNKGFLKGSEGTLKSTEKISEILNIWILLGVVGGLRGAAVRGS